ncbi:MAG: YtxH domain-containing protein [Terriglobales bacterium]|jgi:hypothetical protein
MKFGLVLSDPKLWSSLNDQLRDRADDVSDVVREKYETASDRFSDMSSALRGENQWVAPTLSFVGGIAVGVGLGILFAPMSGEEAREAIRGKANDVKNKVSEMTGRYRGSDATFTGTDGD